MSERPAICGLNEIVTAYEGMRGDSPYFSVWYNGREKAFQYNGDDLDLGLDFLRNNGEAIERSGDTNLYYLRIHSVSQPVYKNNADTVVCGMPIRFVATEGSGVASLSGVSVASKSQSMSYEMWEMLSASKQVPELLKQNAELMQKVIDLENQKEPNDILGRITGFAESNPHVIAPLFNQLGKLIAGFMPVHNMMATTAMAGVSDQPGIVNDLPDNASNEDEVYWAKVDEALSALQQYCDISVYLPKLAIYAEKNPEMFKMLLNNL